VSEICGCHHVDELLSNILSHSCAMFVFISYCTLTDKDRKCFYAANGHIEDLSIAELESCARQESMSMDSFGSVGYHFKKQFDGKWFEGVVVKILVDTGMFFMHRLALLSTPRAIVITNVYHRFSSSRQRQRPKMPLSRR
jgi:hypothetical protein